MVGLVVREGALLACIGLELGLMLVFGTAGSTTNRRVPHPLRSLQRVGYATVGIEIRGIPPFAKSAKDGAPGTRLTSGRDAIPIAFEMVG